MTNAGTPRGPAARGRLLVLALVLGAGALVALGHSMRHPDRPSIILVMIDTLRADYLGAYGFEGDVSPHLDHLAADAVVFEHCYAQAPWTKPSIASLFTSLHPVTHNVLTHGGRYAQRDAGTLAPIARTDALAGELTTLAETLQEAGYVTAAFVANPWLTPALGFAQGFDHFDRRFAGNTTPAGVVLDAARAWMETRPRNRPFFLYLHFLDVHGPYTAPEADYLALRDSPSLGPDRPLTAEEMGRFRRYLGRAAWVGHGDARRLRTWRGRYAAGVRTLDAQLGPFLDELRAAGVLDDAALVVTSDHGEELLDHHGWDHGYNLHEHQLHVPLLVRTPGPPRPGRRVHELVELIDVMPTLLALAGTRTPIGLQGRDLSPLLEGRPESTQTRALLASGVKWKPTRHALRLGAYKLMATLPDGPLELYDLEHDPTEQHDLAREEPAKVGELWSDLDRYLRSPALRPRVTPREVAVPPALEQRLEQLGYVE